MASILGSSSALFINRVGFKLRSPIRLCKNNMYYCTRCSTLEPPNVEKLAKKAHINLTAQEIKDFGPKITQVIDWFGQLQSVDLETVEPSLRADTDASTMMPREDIPETFVNREAILKEIPSFSESYIKVPKVLNKE